MLSKQRWHLDYEEDGRPRNDFPLPLYAFFLMLDSGLLFGAVVLSLMVRSRDRKARELAAAVECGRRILENDR
jgi:hypothetical protein